MRKRGPLTVDFFSDASSLIRLPSSAHPRFRCSEYAREGDQESRRRIYTIRSARQRIILSGAHGVSYYQRRTTADLTVRGARWWSIPCDHCTRAVAAHPRTGFANVSHRTQRATDGSCEQIHIQSHLHAPSTSFINHSSGTKSQCLSHLHPAHRSRREREHAAQAAARRRSGPRPI